MHTCMHVCMHIDTQSFRPRHLLPFLFSSRSTSSMAADALALMDHLSWTQAHIVGHSMGRGMQGMVYHLSK